MFRKSWLSPLTKLQISGLRGGEKHNYCYWVGISESAESDVLLNVMHVRLLNQMASQRSPKFPEGYEPFEVPYGAAKLLGARLCLRTMTVSAPKLKLCADWPSRTQTPRITWERKPACVLNPPRCTAAFHALEAEARIFEIKHRIRRRAVECREKFGSHVEPDGVFSSFPALRRSR
jgi:hypothetical protein